MTSSVPEKDIPHHAWQALLPALMMCLGYLIYSCSDTLIKFLGAHYHFSQVMFLSRFGFFLFIVPYGLLRHGRGAFTTKRPLLLLVPGLLSVMAGGLNMAALPHIPLTTFYTLAFTSPFWVALISTFLLKERLNLEKMIIILIGFAAVVYVLQPGAGSFSSATIMILISAICYSFSIVFVRYMGHGESRVMIVMAAAVAGLAVSGPVVPFYYVTPSFFDLGLFLLVGLLAACGTLCVFYAMQHAPSAATVAPFHYTQIIWGAILGYILFAEVPGSRVITGATVIICAGLYLLYRTTRRKSDVAKATAIRAP